MPLEKFISRAKQKGRIIPFHYMQSAWNFVADKNPVKVTMLQWTEALHGDGYFERDAWKKRNCRDLLGTN